MLELSIHFDNNDKHWYVMNGKFVIYRCKKEDEARLYYTTRLKLGNLF